MRFHAAGALRRYTGYKNAHPEGSPRAQDERECVAPRVREYTDLLRFDLADNSFFYGTEEEFGFRQHDDRWYEGARPEETDHHPQRQQQPHFRTEANAGKYPTGGTQR